MGDKQAISNILYSTKETPVEMNGDVDIKYAAENEVCLPPPAPSIFLPSRVVR